MFELILIVIAGFAALVLLKPTERQQVDEGQASWRRRPGRQAA